MNNEINFDDREILEFGQQSALARGRILDEDDPIMDLLLIQADLQRYLLHEIKKDNQIKIADALISQERFLKGYQKIMQRQFDYSVKEASTTLKKLVEDVNLENVKRVEDRHQQHIDVLYGQFKQYQRILDKDRKILLVLFVINAISVVASLSLTVNLLMNI